MRPARILTRNVLGVNITAHLVGEVALNDGDDLNDCMVGTYNCPSSSVSKRLVNSPISSSGFILWVMSAYGKNSTQYVRQIAINATAIYTRVKGSSSSEWTEWKQFQIS